MFPDEFSERIKKQQYINVGELLIALSDNSPVSIRVNNPKWNKKPADGENVPWSSTGWYLNHRPSFVQDPLFHSGCYYVQEASGMFIEEIYNQVCDRKSSLRVLDLCGAPGGKSTHLSTLIGQYGFLVANEVIRSRAFILAENITRWGLSNTIVTRSDPAAFKNLPGYFDMILVDAPCSGEGMFRDQIAIDEWSEDNAAHCSERQKRILMDVWPALREDGILIYSTCTFNPDENENNIKWLSQNKNAESVRLDISDYMGITEIDYNGIFGYGFYPGRVKGEGLFISIIRKSEKTEEVKLRSQTVKRIPLSTGEKRIAKEWTLFSEDSLFKYGEDLTSLPCSYDDYAFLSKHLGIIKKGTVICKEKGKDFLPSHEMAMSVFMRNNVFHTLNLDLDQALRYLRRENISVTNAPSGWILASYKGIGLGFMKNLGNRINNYYPVGWRIRMDLRNTSSNNQLKWE